MRALIRLTVFTVVLALLAACGADRPPGSPFPAAAGRGSCAVDTERDVGASMRDGVVLRADVYRPRTSDPVPVLVAAGLLLVAGSVAAASARRRRA